MGKAGAARKLASAAAFGGGGLSALGAGLYGVLRVEATLARRAIGNAHDEPFDATGWYGRGRGGPAVKIVLLGDSSAAGYGVARIVETPGALIASGVAEGADRRVHLRQLAKVGAQSSDLAGQLDRALPTGPDLAVILVGANDITHQMLPSQSVRHLAEGVRRAVDAGVQVVVGTCPDLGTVRPIPPPLRQVARAWSRRLAAAQTIAVVEQGGKSVSLASILGPEFDAAPADFFGPDRFHPSALGYSALAGVLLPSCLAALGLAPEREASPEARRGERVLPVARAAVAATRTPGTEVDGSEVAGSPRGVRGLWVELRHRRRTPSDDATAPEDHEGLEETAEPAGEAPAGSGGV